MKEYKEVAYNNMQEMLKEIGNCRIIEGLKAIEFLEENELKVTFNLNATYDFIVLSTGSNGTVKVQNGMKYYNCITLENEYQEIDTNYDNLVALIQIKEHRKARKIEL